MSTFDQIVRVALLASIILSATAHFVARVQHKLGRLDVKQAREFAIRRLQTTGRILWILPIALMMLLFTGRFYWLSLLLTVVTTRLVDLEHRRWCETLIQAAPSPPRPSPEDET